MGSNQVCQLIILYFFIFCHTQMIFFRIDSLFSHDIMNQTEYQVFIIKNSVEIASPYPTVFSHISIGPAILQLNHRNGFSQIGGQTHMNLVTFHHTVIQTIEVSVFLDGPVNSCSGLSSLEGCGGIQQSEASHIAAMLHAIRIVHLLTQKLEATADSNDSCGSGSTNQHTFQSAFNEPFHICHGIFGSRQQNQIRLTQFPFI